MAFAVAKQDVAVRCWFYSAARLNGTHLREKCFLHVGHSYGRSRVSTCAASQHRTIALVLSVRTRSLVAFDVLKLRELAVAQAALFQGHRSEVSSPRESSDTLGGLVSSGKGPEE